MCIAIVKPLGKTISKETLLQCSNNNPDGCGFAYVKDGTIYINKFMDFEAFYDEYVKVEETSPMLIHFRIATHGKVELKNCHPFKLNNHMALIHNGIISGYGDKESKTDTQDFIDKVIGNISWKMWKNPSFIKLVDEAIGYSKLCILDTDGNYYIVGEGKGEWVDGIWFSNKSYKPKEIKKKTYYPKEYNKQGSFWDMYGEESYDDWYKRTYNNSYSSYNYYDDCCDIIYKCEKCGAEIIVSEFNQSKVVCDKCTHDVCKEVGFIFNKERYMLDDKGNYVQESKKESLLV